MSKDREIRKKIEEGDIKGALKIFSTNKSNRIIYALLSYQFSQNEKQKQLGIITDEEYNTATNRIAYKLLNNNKVSGKLIAVLVCIVIIVCLLFVTIFAVDKKFVYGNVLSPTQEALGKVIIRPINSIGQEYYSNSKGEYLIPINEKRSGVLQFPISFDLAGYKTKIEYVSLETEKDSILRSVMLEPVNANALKNPDSLFQQALDSISRTILADQTSPVTARLNRLYENYNSSSSFNLQKFENSIVEYEYLLQEIDIIKRGYKKNSTSHLYLIMHELSIFDCISDLYSSAIIFYRRSNEPEKAAVVKFKFDSWLKKANILILQLEQVSKALHDEEDQKQVVNYWKRILGVH